MRLFLLDQRTQLFTVCHVNDVRAVRHLMTGRVGVAIHRDGFHSETLQRDDDFLAQFTTAQQHDANGGRRERRTDD